MPSRHAIAPVAILVSSAAAVALGHALHNAIPKIRLPNADGRLYERIEIANDTASVASIEFEIRRRLPNSVSSAVEANGESLLIVPGVAKVSPGRRQVFHIEWMSRPGHENSATYIVEFAVRLQDALTGRLDSERQLALAVGVDPDVMLAGSEPNDRNHLQQAEVVLLKIP